MLSFVLLQVIPVVVWMGVEVKFWSLIINPVTQVRLTSSLYPPQTSSLLLLLLSAILYLDLEITQKSQAELRNLRSPSLGTSCFPTSHFQVDLWSTKGQLAEGCSLDFVCKLLTKFLLLLRRFL